MLPVRGILALSTRLDQPLDCTIPAPRTPSYPPSSRVQVDHLLRHSGLHLPSTREQVHLDYLRPLKDLGLSAPMGPTQFRPAMSTRPVSASRQHPRSSLRAQVDPFRLRRILG